MQTGVMKYADPNGRPYTTPNGNFEGHNVTVEINGVPTQGQASCKQGNFPRMQALVGKRVVFEQEPGRQKQDGSFWPPTFKGLKDADAPDRSGFGGKQYDNIGQQIGNCITNACNLLCHGVVKIDESVDPGMAVYTLAHKLMVAGDDLRKDHGNKQPEQPGTQPGPATVGQSYAPQQPPAGGGYYDGDPGHGNPRPPAGPSIEDDQRSPF